MAVKINELIIRTTIEKKDVSNGVLPKELNDNEHLSVKKPMEIVSVNKINRER